jgi:undecaprenyl-diphosphatase
MTLGQAAALGVLQGLTEFLPVSSDGHLALLSHYFQQGSLAFDVALHAGTLLSLLVFFRHDLLRMVRGFFDLPEPARTLERRRVVLIALATVFTGIVGLSLKDTVEARTGSLGAAGAGFLVTAALLALGSASFHRGEKTAADIPLWHMVPLGLIQGAAVWPGWSRSASVISLALVLGWRWDEAGRLGFLMSLPAVMGALLLEAHHIARLDAGPTVVGTLCAFAVGIGSLRVLMRFLKSRLLWPFAIYTLLLGLFALGRAIS